MKQVYSTPLLSSFGSIEDLTHYGSGGGDNDVVYLANPLGDNALTFLQAHGFSLAQAEVAIALQISTAPGGDSFLTALQNIQAAVQGRGSDNHVTLGSTFTP